MLIIYPFLDVRTQTDIIGSNPISSKNEPNQQEMSAVLIETTDINMVNTVDSPLVMGKLFIVIGIYAILINVIIPDEIINLNSSPEMDIGEKTISKEPEQQELNAVLKENMVNSDIVSQVDDPVKLENDSTIVDLFDPVVTSTAKAVDRKYLLFHL